jgi:integrase
MANEIEPQQKSVVKTSFHNEVALTPWVTNPYLNAATSDNTRKAYRSDIKHYEQWGGLLPATPEKVIQYLNTFADKLNSRTLSRRLVALGSWHTYQGFADPTSHPIVTKTMIGITRIHGKPKDKASPLSPEDLIKIAQALSEKLTLMNIRDNAIMQIGYFGALRRSEIINIQYEHLYWKVEGLEILLPHSKTDQSNEGQYCAIPYGNEILCPIKTLKHWLEKSNIQSGAIFRRIFKNNFLSDSPLTPLSLNHIVKRCAILGNLQNADKISPHSLRRGLATSAAHANASIKTIMRAGRWKQVNTVMEYIEASERFSDSAAASVLHNIDDSKI